MLSLLAPSRPAAVAPPPGRSAQREATEVNAPSVIAGTSVTGVYDFDAPTVDQQRTAYRGLIRRLADDRAIAVAEAVQWATVERETRPDEFDEVEASHPWVTLLRRPNPFYSRRVLWRWGQLTKDLAKGAFYTVERAGGTPRGVPIFLHPVFPVFGDMAPVGNPVGGIAYYVFTRSDGQRFRYEVEDVVWIKHPHPVSPYESASLLEAAAYESDADLYAHVYRRDMLRDKGVPRLQITTDQVINRDNADEAELTFQSKFIGPDRIRRVPVFGKGMRLEGVGVSPQDMEAVDAAKLTRTELFHIFGFPEGYYSDHANRANANASQATFIERTAQPEADDFCDQLTSDLARAFRVAEGRRVVVRAFNIVPPDADFQLRQDEAHLRSGQRALNELRERDGFEPLEGGDEPLVSLAVAPLSQIANPPEPPPADPSRPLPDDEEERTAERGPQTGGPGGYTGERGVSTDERDGCAEVAHACTDVRPASTDVGASRTDVADDALTLEWRAVDAAKRRAEAPVETAARAYLIAMRDDVLARLEAERALNEGVLKRKVGLPISAGSLFDLEAWVQAVDDDLGPSFAAAIRAGFLRGAFNADVTLTYDPESAGARTALARVIAKAKTIPETMRAEVEAVVHQGLVDAVDVDELGARLRALFDDMKDWKARQIAQTSGTAAFEAGQAEAFAEAGVERKRWLSQRDGKVRPAHQEMDGEEVGVDQPFSNGLDYPQEINCRCTILPVITGDRSASRPSTRERNAAMKARWEELKRRYDSPVAMQMVLDEYRAENPRDLISLRTVERACYGR